MKNVKDKYIQKVITGQLGDIFLPPDDPEKESIQIFDKLYSHKTALAWFGGVLDNPSVEWTLTSEKSGAKWGEIRAWIKNNPTLRNILKYADICRVEGRKPYRHYLYFDPFYHYLNIKGFLLENGIDLDQRGLFSNGTGGRIFDKRIQEILKDSNAWRQHVLNIAPDQIAYDLGAIDGVSLNPALNKIFRDAEITPEIKKTYSFGSPPVEKRKEVYLLRPHIVLPVNLLGYVQNKPRFDQSLCYMSAISDQVSNLQKRQLDAAVTLLGVATGEDNAKFGYFVSSLEHVINQKYLSDHGFYPHFVENLFYVPNKYNSSLPSWGMSKVQQYITDGCFSQSELNVILKEIYNALYEVHATAADSDKKLQQKALKEILNIIVEISPQKKIINSEEKQQVFDENIMGT